MVAQVSHADADGSFKLFVFGSAAEAPAKVKERLLHVQEVIHGIGARPPHAAATPQVPTVAAACAAWPPFQQTTYTL